MKNLYRPLALATELGMTMGLMTVSTVLAGLFLGLWLDSQLGTRPLATLLFIGAGTVAGLLGTINLARSATRQIDAAVAQHGEARTAFTTRDLGRALLLVLQLIVATLVPVGAGLVVGFWLDRTLGSRPIFTIALAVMSIIGALVGVYFITARAARRAGQDS